MSLAYLDHAATTPIDVRVLEEMMPYFSEKYGNASTLYKVGREAREAVEIAREKVAKLISASPEEVIFTSGGTESNNLAIKGTAFADKGDIITSSIEHHAVLNPCEWLEKKFEIKVTYLPVDKYGLVNLNELENAIGKDTRLISIMHANNEIGTIEPIEEIGKIANEHDIYFHTDAVQSAGKIGVDVKKMNVDLLSISSHKIYGPKGVGALYIKEGVKIEPLLHGGGHEKNLRPGTENVAGIVGFGKAAEIAGQEMEKEAKREQKLRDKLIRGVLEIKNSWLNGHPIKRLPNNANFGFKFIEAEAAVLGLDEKGICASTGSACSSSSAEPSHVLKAIGLKPEDARSSLRLTLGRTTTEEHINYALEVIPKVIERLRAISPFRNS